MTDLLNLPYWNVLKVQETDLNYVIDATYEVEPAGCPHCGFMIRYGHGTKEKLFMDTPIHGKRVGIRAIRSRYKCQNCGKTYIQPLPDMNEDHFMTKRLVSYIEREVFKRTFTAMAAEIGVDEKTIRNVFNEYVEREEKKRVILAPYWLGIDELKIAGGYRGVFSNVKDRCILDLIPNRKKVEVVKFFKKLPEKDRVQLVCMDMWTPYKEIVNEHLPKAQVVVDKFHFIRMASDALEAVRKDVRADLTDRQRRQLMHDRFILLRRKRDLEAKDLILLDSWLGSFPLLKETYELKEELYDIWELKDRKEAEKQYANWQTKIPADGLFAFRPLLTAMQNWRNEIFAYFDHQATNAYTESLNGLMKLANRMGRGYSFEVIRARILYAPENAKTTTLRRGILRDQQAYYMFPPARPRPDYFSGVKISTLVTAIRNDHFLPISTRYSE